MRFTQFFRAAFTLPVSQRASTSIWLNWLVMLCGVISLAAHVSAQKPAPAKPASVTSTTTTQPRNNEVTFKSGTVKLAGTLSLPAPVAGQKFPAVLIASSLSGATRDGVAKGTQPHTLYQELAGTLAAAGFASLRFDPRCMGTSGCGTDNGFDDYVDDMRAAFDTLRTHPEINAKQIFLFGHDESAILLCVIAAGEDSEAAGLVLAAAPGRTLNKVIRERLARQLQADATLTEAQRIAYTAKSERIIRTLNTGSGTAVSAEKLNPADPIDAYLLTVFKGPMLMIPYFVNDPLQIIIGVRRPVLILQGQKDTQSKELDARYFNEALERAHHPDYTLALMPEADHVFNTASGTPDAQTRRTLIDWLKKHSAK